MNRLFAIFCDARHVSTLGLLFVLLTIYLIGIAFDLKLIWVVIAWSTVVLLWLSYLLIKWAFSQRAGHAMENMLTRQTEVAVQTAPHEKKQEIDWLRTRLLDAVQTIKNSKLGQTNGRAALYEMPWYIVIGNPAAGKSTAIRNSGLNFPFADKGQHAIQGIGGTRNCDWFFTTEGILLDTAGRYAVQEEDRKEWFGFLKLLKKYRPKAPINGIIIVVSIAELAGNPPDTTISLARDLRQRVQELTEKLELFAPVYIMFTKADLIAGFVDFFEDADTDERNRVWGATVAYDADSRANAVSLFDQHFDILAAGVKELSTTRMSLNRSDGMSPDVLTFPLEFIGIKNHLRTFIATLFEDNPYQFKPIFRGFYFTSATQEGTAKHATGERIAQQFGLSAGRRLAARISSSSGFFLRNLFSSVIFADHKLVRQYASRRKIQLRYAAFYLAVLSLGLALGGWSWSFINNRQYIENIQADLTQVQKIQATRLDLASRLEALVILQDRLQQLQQYRHNHPLALSFGLYQGERVEHKLRAEYFKGLQQVMLQPVAEKLEVFLTEVIANANKLAAPVRPDNGIATVANLAVTTNAASTFKEDASPYKDVSPSNTDDAYNALKTYLMLANQTHLEPMHLSDQLTRFWRHWLENNRANTSREYIIRDAEKLIAFYLTQAAQPDFPLIENKLTLVEQTRDKLRAVIKGTPARERVYAAIRMRAATRFPITTVAAIVGEQNTAIIGGSQTVSGAFSRVAWEQYVEAAIKDASIKELQSSDWVLKTSAKDDLTLEGSPEQIQKELVTLYKTEYVHAWKKFMQGILIKDFTSFDNAVLHMNALGDPQSSPIHTLMQTLYRETSWDNPSLGEHTSANTQRGMMRWFSETVLRQTPNQSQAQASDTSKLSQQTGMVGKQFTAIANLMLMHGNNKDGSLMQAYLAHLAKVRTRFNQISHAGDLGPASRQFMQATMDGNDSELTQALKYIDENMLNGMPSTERSTIRPLLVRPLMQAFAVMIAPTEAELNRTWLAQVHTPFTQSLASKYPFTSDSQIEATAGEIAQVFGPDGAIAKYVQTTMGPLVIRRGDTLASRTWGEMGVRLNPLFSTNLVRYVAAHGATAAGANGIAAAQTNFQLLPIPSSGLNEYSVEIDGQTLRYRNGQQIWHNFIWPNGQSQPGAKITAVTMDGRTLDIANFPGQFGLEKLINAAERQKLEQGIFQMQWSGAGQQVALRFRLISDARPGTTANASATGGMRLHGLTLPTNVVGEDPATTAAPANPQVRS